MPHIPIETITLLYNHFVDSDQFIIYSTCMYINITQACRGRAGIKEDNEDFGHDVAVVQSRGGQSNTKTNMTKGVDNKDAVGSLPKEDKEPDHVEEIPITLAELHYNDCVVVFGSMSGKHLVSLLIRMTGLLGLCGGLAVTHM